MMKVASCIVPLVVVAMLALPGSAVQAEEGTPQGPPGVCDGHGPRGPALAPGLGMGLLRGAHRLDLTEAQLDQIDAIFEASRPQVETLRNELRTSREAWAESHDPAQLDETAARVFADQQAALHADLMVLHMQTRAQALSVLTDEQRAELEAMREERQSRGFRRGHRHCKRFGGGAGAGLHGGFGK
jgi:Spy/CpxP family protein refolding chaperone